MKSQVGVCLPDGSTRMFHVVRSGDVLPRLDTFLFPSELASYRDR